MKNGQLPEKKLRNLVVSKPENQNLRFETAIKVEFEKRKHSFIADSKLKFDQIKKKMEFLKVKKTKSFQETNWIQIFGAY